MSVGPVNGNRPPEKDPMWSFRERRMREQMPALVKAAMALAGEVTCWDAKRSESVNRLSVLEEELYRLRTEADEQLRLVGALLDYAAKEEEPSALPRAMRLQHILDKLRWEKRRSGQAH